MNLKDYLLNEGVYDPSIFKAFFLAGGPGSGKSYVAGKTTLGHGLKLINSDTLFEVLMKKANMSLNFIGMSKSDIEKRDKIRAFAKKLTSKQKKIYIDGRLGLVVDGTGRHFDKIKNQKEKLNTLGYDTYMIFVNTSLDVALERNVSRYRVVDPDFVKKAWNEVQNNIGKFQALFGNEYFIIVDNNNATEDVFAKVWKKVLGLLKNKINNPVAKAWIASELKGKFTKTE
jgi:cytidylate kinase